ncbi:MAG: hypothetical protein R6U96_11295 [Promethearchaeia archaeon]
MEKELGMDLALIEYILWAVVSVGILIYFVSFFRRALKNELKDFNFAASSIFLALFFDSVKRLIFPGEIFMIFISNLALSVFTLPLVYHLEKNVIRKTKQIISILIVVLIGLFLAMTIISSFERATMNLFILFPLLLEVGLIIFVYIYLILKGVGEIRKSSTFILTGLLITISMWFVHSQIGRRGPMVMPGIVDIIGILAPLSIFIGLTLSAFGFFKVEEE